MSNNLYSLVLLAKKEEQEENLITLIEVFRPIINKYGRLLRGEDTRQDLTLHSIKVIKNYL